MTLPASGGDPHGQASPPAPLLTECPGMIAQGVAPIEVGPVELAEAPD